MPVTVGLIFPGCELTGIQVPARGKKGGAELRKKPTTTKKTKPKIHYYPKKPTL